MMCVSGYLQVIDWRVLALTGASLNVDGDEAGVWGGWGFAPVTAVCHLCSSKWSRGGTL